MPVLIFSLCALTALACTLMLARTYLRTRVRLLFWSALCFAGLTANNVLLVLDKTVFADIDLSTWRLVVALAAMLMLVFGLVMERGQ
ncbi:MAG TPA: DUF5985 family protein [Burkholderiaceae bacterium]|jgi:hypothetical protein